MKDLPRITIYSDVGDIFVEPFLGDFGFQYADYYLTRDLSCSNIINVVFDSDKLIDLNCENLIRAAANKNSIKIFKIDFNLNADRIKVFDVTKDKVIDSSFILGVTNYNFAINVLCGLIDKLDMQRNLESSKIYQRLQKDLIAGCVMPSITIAFVDKFASEDILQIEDYVNKNISNAFVLDGIQRLNTLRKVSGDLVFSVKDAGKIYLNILICSSRDNLLYRMITLNNGQRPMSAAHQIEILASNQKEFVELTRILNDKILTEKDGYKKDAFNKASMVRGYMAFLTENINIDNNRIIEAKLDEMNAERILDHYKENASDVDFSNIAMLIMKFFDNADILKWFRVDNNLIGFCVGVKKSYDYLKDVSDFSFLNQINKLESALKNFERSKIKVGTVRRKAVMCLIGNYEHCLNLDENELLDYLSTDGAV